MVELTILNEEEKQRGSRRIALPAGSFVVEEPDVSKEKVGSSCRVIYRDTSWVVHETYNQILSLISAKLAGAK